MLGKIALLLFIAASFGFGARGETVLDMLVLYTDDLLYQYSDEDGVRAHVLASVASANQAFSV